MAIISRSTYGLAVRIALAAADKGLGMLGGIYGERHLRAIIGAAGERVDAALVDPAGWDDFVGMIAEAFPESCISWAFHAADGRVGAVAAGWDPKAIEAYEAHYAATNPFTAHWTNAPPQRALVAGTHAPAIGAYADTEFVTDWLDPQGDLRGAAGVRIGRPNDDLLTFVSTHYPARRAARYDTALELVFGALADRLASVQGLVGTMVVAGERAADRASVLDRMPGIAFVIDGDRRVREMCDRAARRKHGDCAHLTHHPPGGDRLAFRDPAIERWFDGALARAIAGLAVDGDRLFAWSRGTVRVRIARLPSTFDGAMAHALGTRRALVIVEEAPPTTTD